jgi:PAS domain S-box-containing protein
MADNGRHHQTAWEAEMFRLLAKNVKDYAIFIVDPHGHVLSWNKGAQRLLGFSEDQIVGRKCDCFFTPEDVQAGIPQKELDEALRTGRGEDDRWHVRKDGSRFWSSGTVTPLREPGGTLRGFAKILRDRTELKRAEEAAYERARQLHLLTDHAPVLIAHCDADRRYKFVNKPYAARFNLHPRQVVGRSIRDVLGEAVYAVIERYVDAALAGERVELEVEVPYGGLGPQTMWCSYDPEFDADGRVVGLVAAVVNVTESRRARQALHESEERFARLMQHLPGLAWIKDIEGQYVYANDAAVNAFGKPRAELYGKAEEEVFPPATAAQFRENDRRALAGGTGVRVIETLQYADGVLHHSLVSKFPIPGPDGRVALVGGMAIDITEEIRTRAVLEESEERFRATFEQAAVGIAHVGPDGQWLRVNQKLCDIVGYRPEELLALTFQDITHPEDLEADLAQVRRLLAGEIQTYAMEKRYFRKDRSLVWINLTVSLVRTPQGQPKYFISVVEDITEQKGVRDALRESETKYRNLFRNMAEEVHFWQVVRDGQGDIQTWRLVDANPPALRTWGKTLDQIRGKTADEIFGPGSTDHYRGVVRKVMAEGVPHAFEDYFPNLDRHFRFTTVPLGEFFITTGADITAIKKAHAALRESEERLRTLSDNLPQGAVYQVVADPDGGRRFLYISAGVERLFGVTPAEALADASALNGLVHEEDRPRVAAAEEAAHRDLTPFNCEFRSWTRSGGLVWLHARSAPRRLPAGEVVWEGILLDITARTRAEEALDRERELLGTVFDRIPAMLTVYQPDTRVLRLNPAFERATGWSARDAAGVSLMEQCYPDPAYRERVREFMQSCRGGWMDLLMRTRDGRDLETSWANVRLSDGTQVGIGLDITDCKRYEQSLKEADRRKDEFLATLAHELRNPLAPLRNGLQLLRLAGDNRAVAEQAQDMMERQLQQMVRLIDDLLDVSRITRGKLQLRSQQVSLASVVRSAVEGSRPLIEAFGHALGVTLPPEPVWLDADPTRLAQVFGNLLTNAAKYTDPGGHIGLTAERHGGEVVVLVRDTGVGIAPEHLPRLFEMFSQVDSALERSQGGLGIGLSLVKGLVEMHGGKVEARSEGPGKGSEFIVRLPVSGAGPEQESGSAGEREARSAPGRRILVAEDNRDTADSLAAVLRLAGHEVHVTQDGLEAVKAAGWFRPDVALLDIGMPRLNGYEAARRIREQPGGKLVTLVAITGWGQEEDKRQAAEAGFDRHLTKPVDPRALEQILVLAVPFERPHDG